jgi:hypothetical protein
MQLNMMFNWDIHLQECRDYLSSMFPDVYEKDWDKIKHLLNNLWVRRTHLVCGDIVSRTTNSWSSTIITVMFALNTCTDKFDLSGAFITDTVKIFMSGFFNFNMSNHTIAATTIVPENEQWTQFIMTIHYVNLSDADIDIIKSALDTFGMFQVSDREMVGPVITQTELIDSYKSAIRVLNEENSRLKHRLQRLLRFSASSDSDDVLNAAKRLTIR